MSRTNLLAFLGLTSPIVPMPFFIFGLGPMWLISAVVLGTPTVWLIAAVVHITRSEEKSRRLLMAAPVAFIWVIAASLAIGFMLINCANGQCADSNLN